MSWASPAAQGRGGIDASPLAATVRANQAGNGFFPEATVALADLPIIPSPAPSPIKTSATSSSARKPSIGNLRDMSDSGMMPSETGTSSAASFGSAVAAATSAFTPTGGAQLLPLHAQEALRNEVAHLRRELLRSESRLREREAAFAKTTDALHALQQDKLSEQSRARHTVDDLRKAVVEGESRLAFFRDELEARKLAEIATIQRHNTRIVAGQAALLDAVGETIKNSAPNAPTSADGDFVSPPPFNGSGTGMTHEAHLRSVHEGFRQERLAWDRAKAEELRTRDAEHAAELEAQRAHSRRLKSQYASQYATWQRQHGVLMRETAVLSEYLVKLTSLLGEIDRGTFPVSQKHGVTTFVIPSHRRAFLKLDWSAAEVAEGALGRKLVELQACFARADLPWDPQLLHLNQSFASDEKQRQVRMLQATKAAEQLRLQAPDSDDDDEEEQRGTTVGGLLSPSPPKHQQPRSGEEKEEDDDIDAAATSSVSESPALRAAFYAELRSDATVQHIARVEAERDRLKHELARETRHRVNMHQTLASQSRLREANELLARTNSAASTGRQQRSAESARRRSASTSSTTRHSSVGGTSMTQLLAVAQANASGFVGGSGSVAASGAVSPHLLNHSRAASAGKSRDIVAASQTVALAPAAGRLGVNVGFRTSFGEAEAVLAPGALTTGPMVGTLSASGSLTTLTTHARPVVRDETAHTNGAYRNANAPPSATNSGTNSATPTRPASAVVRGSTASPSGGSVSGVVSVSGGGAFAHARDTRPVSAVSAASVYLQQQGVGSPPVAVRPTSAFATMLRSPPGSSTAVPAYNYSLATSPPMPASHFARPTPLHVAHGNAPSVLFAHQLARKSHRDSYALATSTSSERDDDTATPNTTSNSTAHTAANSTRPSAHTSPRHMTTDANTMRPTSTSRAQSATRKARNQ